MSILDISNGLGKKISDSDRKKADTYLAENDLKDKEMIYFFNFILDKHLCAYLDISGSVDSCNPFITKIRMQTDHFFSNYERLLEKLQSAKQILSDKQTVFNAAEPEKDQIKRHQNEDSDFKKRTTGIKIKRSADTESRFIDVLKAQINLQSYIKYVLDYLIGLINNTLTAVIPGFDIKSYLADFYNIQFIDQYEQLITNIGVIRARRAAQSITPIFLDGMYPSLVKIQTHAAAAAAHQQQQQQQRQQRRASLLEYQDVPKRKGKSAVMVMKKVEKVLSDLKIVVYILKIKNLSEEIQTLRNYDNTLKSDVTLRETLEEYNILVEPTDIRENLQQNLQQKLKETPEEMENNDRIKKLIKNTDNLLPLEFLRQLTISLDELKKEEEKLKQIYKKYNDDLRSKLAEKKNKSNEQLANAARRRAGTERERAAKARPAAVSADAPSRARAPPRGPPRQSAPPAPAASPAPEQDPREEMLAYLTRLHGRIVAEALIATMDFGGGGRPKRKSRRVKRVTKCKRNCKKSRKGKRATKCKRNCRKSRKVRKPKVRKTIRKN